ncbi:uncharacterized protein LOC122923841 [Bufo gargarizans]|uniref:uncharacterized protein LOC122923841 n=1 Tax=Bufo gargarizans TaxID=30331 RepID=UPI001CF491FA|nr:uncharacterized protein LOC122923841 [Bufo gargarizans]
MVKILKAASYETSSKGFGENAIRLQSSRLDLYTATDPLPLYAGSLSFSPRPIINVSKVQQEGSSGNLQTCACKFHIYNSKASEMVWGQKISFCLMIILHGLFCDGLLYLECSTKTWQCGETVTMTCTPTHPLEEIHLKRIEGGVTLLKSDLPTKNELFTEDRKISIEGTEKEVKITIYDVKFTDTYKYILHVAGPAGYTSETIIINVSGICKPKINREETKELVCEAETEKNASIVWMDDHRNIYPSSKTKLEKVTYFKLWSSLKLSEEIKDSVICCSVSYPDGIYKDTCFPRALGTVSTLLGSKSPTLSIVLVLLAVALVAAAFGYLLKRRNRNIMRARSLSQGPLIDQKAPEEEENITHPPLVPPSPV